MLHALSFVGIFGLCFIAWLGSEDRRIVPWRLIAWGVGLQLVIGLLVFRVPPTRDLVQIFNDLLNAIIDAADEGGRFLFGPVLVPPSGQAPGPVLAGRWIARAITPPYVPVPGDRLGGANINVTGNPGFFIFAFRSLPQIIFFAALISLLYRLNVIQPIVRFFAVIFRRAMRISGAESLAGAANIFVGIESAIAIKPYLPDMTRSELCAILTSCFGSIASTVLAIYAGFLRPTFPAITGHLMSASVLTIPACFVVAKILVPERDTPKTLGALPEDVEEEEKQPSIMDSLILGALDGVKMAVGIAAVLIAILGLVALLNTMFDNLAGLADSPVAVFRTIGQVFSVITIENILGAIFLPLTFLTGVSLDWQELWTASVLIGQRLLLTAIPSYQQLSVLSATGEISNRAVLIVSYVLCGFAHVASVGIFAGGLAGLAPNRRQDISSIVWKALWGGTLATLMTGCIAGIYFYEGAAVLGQ
jgi:CNT family concentrative nucleoside transporter